MYQVLIEKLDDFGRGIAHINNKVVFIANALPEEEVEIKIINDKKSYMEASVVKYIKLSKDRIESKCPYFEVCGGCNLLHLSYENTLTFKQSKIKELLKKNKINYKAALNLLREEALPLNLKWLKSLSYSTEPIQERVEKSLLYPLEKVFICEGITEETLLPVFAKLLGYDFEKNGIYVLSAGGKNQVVKTFYRLVDILKIPIFVLLDSDAGENYNEILPRLRSIDKVHVLKIGEFEDALPPHLVERTLAYATRNISLAPHDDITSAASRVEYLENFFKHRGLHEFKKSEFANMVKNNILDFSDVSDEIKEVIEELRTLNANCENISSG